MSRFKTFLFWFETVTAIAPAVLFWVLIPASILGGLTGWWEPEPVFMAWFFNFLLMGIIALFAPDVPLHEIVK